jgi:predicted HAD superfamily phosphohydrolase YqeG
MRVANDLDHVELMVAAAPTPVVMIFDADNTLVRQGAPLDEFKKTVSGAADRFEQHPSVARVIILTNGPDRGVPQMVHRGNKPWTTRRRLGLESVGRDIWVVGDQPLTDGVLAWRLAATFVYLAIDEETEAPRQAFMRRIGRRVARLLFQSEGDGSGPG